jgi:hypothetical protein
MMGLMAAIPPVAHAAFTDAPARHQKGGDRAATMFGGAVTYREMVEAKLRVDPVSLAEKKRPADPLRPPEKPPPREEEYEEPGGRLDISV